MSRFLKPAALPQALEALAGNRTRVVAGGTDLMVQLREAAAKGEEPPGLILDVSALPELLAVDLAAERPFFGAAVTFRRLETDPAVASAYPLLALSAATVGSVQIRQTATLGGNVANASPAADGTTALTALGARAVIASHQGRRRCRLEELISEPGRTTLDPKELILGFELDRPAPGSAQVFAKVGRRAAVAVARMNLAVCLDRELQDPRVVLGACFPAPRRLSGVEELISSGRPGPDLWLAAGRRAADHFVHVCGWRSSADYKVPAVTRVVARTLAQAWARLEERP